MYRLKTIRESINEAEITTKVVDLSTYDNAEEVSELPSGFDLYKTNDSRHLLYLVVEDGSKVVGEITLGKTKTRQHKAHAVHTADFAKGYTGKGLYLEALKEIIKDLKSPIISYPFDDDSEQERSEMANKFWAKNGEAIGKMDGEPIYLLNESSFE